MDPVQVLAAERRRRILALVWDEERTAGEIAAHFEVSWPAISQHLRILREAGFVTQRRDGNRRHYRAVPEALGALRAIVEQQWRSDLQHLKHTAEAAHRQTEPHADVDAGPGPGPDPDPDPDPESEQP